ncbi:transmembrane protein [Thalictrum thalictroides]|uniref:Transmembrane protein n=1 Tax=Thalictrum thalictroides TaxID=46969 RepID=A0A7J6WZS4_THATH|nr:transmembrane protein [Thalictrum thalictroides]
MAQHRQPSLRSRKFRRFINNSRNSVVLILFLVAFFSIIAYHNVSKQKELNSIDRQDEEVNDDFLENVTWIESDKVVNFGQGSIVNNGGDSRYWDRDDWRRDVGYAGDVHGTRNERAGGGRNARPYNEARRYELKVYEVEFAESLKNVGQSTPEKHNVSNNEVLEIQNEDYGLDDEYDDAIDSQDSKMADHEKKNDDTGESFEKVGTGTEELHVGGDAAESKNTFTNISEDKSSQTAVIIEIDSRQDNTITVQSANRSILNRARDLRRPVKAHKFTGSSCEIKFINSTAQLVEPVESEEFSRISLQYTDVEERPRFAGHQSLEEREESFYARDQKINCGFIRGPKGSLSTGFDLEEEDMRYTSSCHIAVSSCIFGNSDKLRPPFGKTVTRLSRKSVCFVMFMDEKTMQYLSSEGQKPDEFGFVGLWKIVVVKNLPFADMRRVGKIPKFLAHRLFPFARYSIWLDSKLRLQIDPLLILEYFLWRKGYEYAISNHYRRHCVWEEVAQNKRLNKFNHTVIDRQFHFYQADGLKRFNESDRNKLLPSNVPEGSFIVRAHTPMSNLFSCLWFNEVDRFTPRDQLSFAYVYHKFRRMNSEKPFRFNMFKDCERRAIAKLFPHRSEEKRNIPFQAIKKR